VGHELAIKPEQVGKRHMTTFVRTVTAFNSFGREMEMDYVEYVKRWTSGLRGCLPAVADNDSDTQIILDMTAKLEAIASRRFEELYAAQNGKRHELAIKPSQVGE